MSDLAAFLCISMLILAGWVCPSRWLDFIQDDMRMISKSNADAWRDWLCRR